MKATRFWFRCSFVDLSWFLNSDLTKIRPFSGLTIQKVSVQFQARGLQIQSLGKRFSPAALHWMTPHCYLVGHWWSKTEAMEAILVTILVGPTDRSHWLDITDVFGMDRLVPRFGEIRSTFLLHLRTLAVRRGNLSGQLQWPGCFLDTFPSRKESTAFVCKRLAVLHRFRYFLDFDFLLPIPNIHLETTSQVIEALPSTSYISNIRGDLLTRLPDLQRGSAASALWSPASVAVSVWWQGHRRWRLSFTEFDGRGAWLFGDAAGLWEGDRIMHTTYLDVRCLALNEMLVSHCAHWCTWWLNMLNVHFRSFPWRDRLWLKLRREHLFHNRFGSPHYKKASFSCTGDEAEMQQFHQRTDSSELSELSA